MQPNQMPKPPDLIPLDGEAQRQYSKSLLDDETSHLEIGA